MDPESRRSESRGRRWPFPLQPKRGYLKRLYQAHRLHHAVAGRDGAKYLLTFRPFGRLPPAIRKAYLDGRLDPVELMRP